MYLRPLLIADNMQEDVSRLCMGVMLAETDSLQGSQYRAAILYRNGERRGGHGHACVVMQVDLMQIRPGMCLAVVMASQVKFTHTGA